MRALHALGHPGGSAGVEDGRKALRGVVQPGRRLSSGHPLRQRQDVERRQVAEPVLPAGENDHRLGVVEHVGDQGVGQGGVEEHHGAAGLENAEVSGHDLPVVLRHGHGHDLVRAGEEGSKGRGHVLRARVELGEGQGLSGVGNLQGREMRELRGGAAEDLREPADAFLMRHVHEVAVAEDIRQAVWAGVRRRHLLRRPKVPPPRHERQHEDDREDGCDEELLPRLFPHMLVSLDPWGLRGTLGLVRGWAWRKPSAQSKYRCSVPFRRTSKVTQWGPPPIILECRNFRGMTSRPFFSRSFMSVG